MTLEDTGLYSCQAANRGGSRLSNMTLQITGEWRAGGTVLGGGEGGYLSVGT